MPAIDYRRLRVEISMRQVLELIGFEPGSLRDGRCRGACPLPACRASVGRTFSIDLGRGIFHCFACGSAGNQLDLWASLHHLPLHAAAQSLCSKTHTPIPWLAQKRS